jgi:hypothetical protein
MNSLDTIYDHLKTLGDGKGVVASLFGNESILFLTPISAYKDRLSGISVIRLSQANDDLRLEETNALFQEMVGENSFNDVVQIANNCQSLPIEVVKYWESLMEKLRFEYDGDNIDLDNVIF